jgi:hypothetical protein
MEILPYDPIEDTLRVVARECLHNGDCVPVIRGALRELYERGVEHGLTEGFEAGLQSTDGD